MWRDCLLSSWRGDRCDDVPVSEAHLERRSEIVDLAAHVFSDRGYADASMLDIAEQAGIKPGSLYHHFTSKDELAAEVIQRFHSDLGDCTERMCARSAPATPAAAICAVREWSQQIGKVYASHRGALQLSLYDLPSGSHLAFRPAIQTQPESVSRRWQLLVSRLSDTGALVTDLDLEILARTLHHVVERTAIMEPTLTDNTSTIADNTSAIDCVLDLIFHGLLPQLHDVVSLDKSSASQLVTEARTEWENQSRTQTVTRKSSLVAVAADEFARHGFAATTMRGIATAAGMNPASIYYHFASKDLLAEEIMARFSGQLLRGMQAVADSNSTAAQRMDALISLHTYATHQFRSEINMLKSWRHFREKGIWDRIVSEGRTMRAIWERTLAEGWRRGELRNPAPLPLLFVCLRELVWSPAYEAPPTVDPARMQQFYRSTLLNGAIKR